MPAEPSEAGRATAGGPFGGGPAGRGEPRRVNATKPWVEALFRVRNPLRHSS
jgi:hypothetical protein